MPGSRLPWLPSIGGALHTTIFLGDVDGSGLTALVILLVVVLVAVVAVLLRVLSQKRKTELAAARILSMSENMLNLSSLPFSRTEIGGYRLQQKLSEGVGFITYRGVNSRNEPCELKIPTSSALEDKTTIGRIEREASILSAINNPHVQHFKAFEKLKDRGRVIPMLVTDPIIGEELSSVLKRTGPLHPLDVVSIMLDMTSALADVHRCDVVHRNVKPLSILLTAEGRAILSNFGIVQSEAQQQLTQRGDVLGTGLYMSPEQITGKPLDGRSDLYSLGIVAFEMLTGQAPYAGTTFGELVMHKMTQDPPHPSLLVANVPAELDDLIARMMEKDPSRRPASAGYLTTELQMLEQSLEQSAEESEATQASDS